MIRILHVVSSLNINAGMMSVIMNHYRHIDRDRVQFDFLYFEEFAENHMEEIISLGGRAFYIPYPTFRPSDQKKLHVFFQSHIGEFAAVHCHPIWASEVVAHEAKRSGIKHIIQHSHSTRFAETKKSEIRNRILLKFIGLFATDYIACSPEASLLFGKKRARAGSVYILPNAISIDQYAYSANGRERIRREFHVDDHTILLGNVGRLSLTKNQLFAVSVFSEIKKINPNVKMLIVGEGAQKSQIEERICELHLSEAVILTGKRKDIRDILSGMDIFLMPSIFEGVPVSAIEAAAAGLPCLLSDTITRSVDMEGVRYCSLQENARSWAETALALYKDRKFHDRNDNEDVIRHGFDICTQSELLENYYLNLR